MKKIIALFLAVLMLAACFAGCSKPADNTDGTKGTTEPKAEEKVVVVGYTIYAPMNYKEEGSDELIGFDTDLAKAVFENLGYNVMFKEIDWNSKYTDLSSGNIDCAWGGIVLDDAQVEKGRYAKYGPYVENDIVIATRSNSRVWNRLMLSGKNMSMPSTTEAMDALMTDEKLPKRLGQVTRLAGGTMECFQYLYQGKCDAVLTDSTALYYYNCH